MFYSVEVMYYSVELMFYNIEVIFYFDKISKIAQWQRNRQKHVKQLVSMSQLQN
jgi:hypothetical protein